MSVTKRMRFEVLQRDSFKCVYCKRGELPLEVDHVIPRSLGGTDSMNNLVSACSDCNQGKSSSAAFAHGDNAVLKELLAQVNRPGVKFTRRDIAFIMGTKRSRRSPDVSVRQFTHELANIRRSNGVSVSEAVEILIGRRPAEYSDLIRAAAEFVIEESVDDRRRRRTACPVHTAQPATGCDSPISREEHIK